MAKNFFEQLRDLISGPKIPQDSDTESQDTSGLSGVERYLAKQAKAAQEQVSAAAEQQLTGVERYLAKQAQALAEKEPAAAPATLTGVEKYLAKQGAIVKEIPAAPVPVTGVDKYLAKKTTQGHVSAAETAPTVTIDRTPEAAPRSAPVVAPKAAKTPVAESKKTPAASKKAASAAKETAVTEAGTVTEERTAAAQTAEESKPKTPHIVKLSENATQCQARTAKGAQCKNTTHLTHIHRTINKQQYEFAVCTQHHNPSFKPFPPLIENL
ncbi:MAG: hypothetical protein ACU837_09685 [Gammaproteobacteria bacterium]